MWLRPFQTITRRRHFEALGGHVATRPPFGSWPLSSGFLNPAQVRRQSTSSAISLSRARVTLDCNGFQLSVGLDEQPLDGGPVGVRCAFVPETARLRA